MHLSASYCVTLKPVFCRDSAEAAAGIDQTLAAPPCDSGAGVRALTETRDALEGHDDRTVLGGAAPLKEHVGAAGAVESVRGALLAWYECDPVEENATRAVRRRGGGNEVDVYVDCRARLRPHAARAERAVLEAVIWEVYVNDGAYLAREGEPGVR